MTQQTGESELGGHESESASVQDRASAAAQTATESGAGVAQTAADETKHVAAEAARQSRNLMNEARWQATEQATVQQRKAVSGLRAMGDELRSMAEQGGQSGLASEVAYQASDQTHNVANWLDQREPGDLLDEVRRFAQRRPGAFLLGAALAGAVAGRLTRGVKEAGSDDASASTQQHPAPPGAGVPQQGSYAYGAPAYDSSYDGDELGDSAVPGQDYDPAVRP
ncbi:MAG: hypothetical protein ABJA86_13045 [Nocardioidaceae bacterium]